MIDANSRYADSQLITIKKDGRNVVVITPSQAQSYTFSYVSYLVNGGDRIDLIANAFYDDPSQWWRISDANPEIMDFTVLKAGTTLRIPNA